MSISNLYPSISPSLSLDFAAVKKLDSRITFTRTTTATYYGTETAKAEENLILQSQFASGWTNFGTNTITANNTTAPDGTSTAALVSSPASADYVYQVSTIVVGQVYTTSVFVKNTTGGNAATISLLFVRNTSNNAQVSINWTGSTLSSVTLTDGTAADFVSVGNDWYRVRVTFTALEATPRFRIYGGDSVSTTGDIFVWGAQLEQRSAVTAYTPTTTQPITNYVPALQTAASGVARFDHNPTTFESLGLLVEEQRTNLILQSEDFSTTWSATRSSVTTNTIVAPNGTLTGDKLVEDTTSANNHFVSQGISWTSGTSYTYTVYLKKAERTWAALRLPSAVFTSNLDAFFDLNNGVVGAVTSPATSSIQSVGNGWYRCSITASATATTSGSLIIFIAENNSDVVFTGDGFSGLFLWGAQLEAGAFPTSYIPTVAATVTRNADVASMTGTNFSSWYRADEGTLYAEASVNKLVSAFNHIAAFMDSSFATSTATRIIMNTSNQVSCRAFGTSIYASGAVTDGQSFKAIVSYKQNDCGGYVDGSGATDNNLTNNLTATIFGIGLQPNVAGNKLNGTIKKLSFYPSRLTDAQLQALTS